MHLNDYLKVNNISQEDFGKLINPPVLQTHVSKWVRGVIRVTLEQALQIQKVTEGAVNPTDCNAMFRRQDFN